MMQCVFHHKAEAKLEQLDVKGETFYQAPRCCCRTRLCTRDRYQSGGAKSNRSCRQAQMQAILKQFQHALAKAQAKNDCASQVNLLKRIGLIHCQRGECAWGIKCFEQALHIAITIRDQANVGIICNYIGAACRQTGQNHKALNVYLQALAIFRNSGDKLASARILNRLGEIYISLGQSERSLTCCRQALKIFQEMGNFPDHERAALHAIGEAYCQLGRHRPALALFEQALAICQKIGKLPNGDRVALHNSKATTLESMGIAYIKLNQELRALEFFTQALKIRHDIGESPNAEARSLDYIGAVHYKQGNYPRAVWYHLQAAGILQAHNHTASSVMFLYDKAGSERFLHNLVAVYERLGLHTQGTKCYEQALEIVKTFGDNPSEEAIWNYFQQDGNQLN